MKLFIVVSFLCLVALATGIKLDDFSFMPRHGLTPLIKAKGKSTRVSQDYIYQPLDHFNPQNKDKWQMRYLKNDQFFKAGGPIFVMLGGEWTISNDLLLNGQMYEMAKENNAHMMYTEHRFYGESCPTENLSVDNLKKYFNTDQALADVVFLLRNIKAVNPTLKDSKVVVFGGSYSATMATWLREKYPDDIFAAVSSSAALDFKENLEEYFEVVGRVLGKECSGVITRAFQQVIQLFGTPEGAVKVQQDFNTCHLINTNDIMEVSRFFQLITNTFSNLVQFNSCDNVQNLCNELIYEPDMDDYTKISTLIRQATEHQGICLPSFQDYVEEIQNEYFILWRMNRQWTFQNCFQIGSVPITSSRNQPFLDTVPIETAVYKACEVYFGHENYTSLDTKLGTKRLNMIYGGLKPNITRVVSVHGLNDPWYPTGLSEDLNPLAPVMLVPGASHTFDLADIDEKCDNEYMINAKLAVRRYIKNWLNE